ncbi:hypothetical protein MP228_012320 [Amoeboaphelidium protococcarum]|nr:hypothetical protein MP228_012320 [Amoeboaphelidium protococcarum]
MYLIQRYFKGNGMVSFNIVPDLKLKPFHVTLNKSYAMTTRIFGKTRDESVENFGGAFRYKKSRKYKELYSDLYSVSIPYEAGFKASEQLEGGKQSEAGDQTRLSAQLWAPGVTVESSKRSSKQWKKFEDQQRPAKKQKSSAYLSSPYSLRSKSQSGKAQSNLHLEMVMQSLQQQEQLRQQHAELHEDDQVFEIGVASEAEESASSIDDVVQFELSSQAEESDVSSAANVEDDDPFETDSTDNEQNVGEDGGDQNVDQLSDQDLATLLNFYNATEQRQNREKSQLDWLNNSKFQQLDIHDQQLVFIGLDPGVDFWRLSNVQSVVDRCNVTYSIWRSKTILI